MSNLLTSRGTSGFTALLAVISLALAAVFAWIGFRFTAPLPLAAAAVMVLVALLIPQSLVVADQWQRMVVLRLGRLQGIRGPGAFLIIPYIDSVAIVIDQRIQTATFSAERTLTRDTVPVDVDAIIFWQVHDVERAALEIANYQEAVSQVAQTSLREVIGATELSALLSERRKIDGLLRDEIGVKTAEWGVGIISVEVRDVAIPPGLQDAMSRRAQAEREREARIILGTSEQQIAQIFVDAAMTYAKSPDALQLRAMNLVYEATKERGMTIVIPSRLADSMSGLPGLVAGAAAGAG